MLEKLSFVIGFAAGIGSLVGMAYKAYRLFVRWNRQPAGTKRGREAGLRRLTLREIWNVSIGILGTGALAAVLLTPITVLGYIVYAIATRPNPRTTADSVEEDLSETAVLPSATSTDAASEDGDTKATDLRSLRAEVRAAREEGDTKAPAGIPLPFFDNFQDIAEGQLPKGWTSDDSVGVRRGDGLSWIQAATIEHHRLTTPEIGVASDFDLELWCSCGSEEHLNVTLLSDEAEDVPLEIHFSPEFVTRDEHWKVSVPRFKLSVSADTYSEGRERLRIVRRGSACHLLFKDQVQKFLVPITTRFRGLAFEWRGLANSRNAVKLYSIAITHPALPEANVGPLIV
jgi:hypothetical protein